MRCPGYVAWASLKRALRRQAERLLRGRARLAARLATGRSLAGRRAAARGVRLHHRVELGAAPVAVVVRVGLVEIVLGARARARARGRALVLGVAAGIRCAAGKGKNGY